MDEHSNDVVRLRSSIIEFLVLFDFMRRSSPSFLSTFPASSAFSVFDSAASALSGASTQFIFNTTDISFVPPLSLVEYREIGGGSIGEMGATGNVFENVDSNDRAVVNGLITFEGTALASWLKLKIVLLSTVWISSSSSSSLPSILLSSTNTTARE